jgi:uncharacterized membrane protein YdbT with pleckstrin-like domain
MANVLRQLTDDEELVLDLHPHWRRLIVPFLAVPVVAGLVTFLLLVGSPAPAFRSAVLGVAVLVLLVVSGRPYLQWRSTRYVVTTRRVLGRAGVFTRIGHQVPLYRLDDVRSEATLVGRLTGSGDLVLESAGDEDELRFVDVPRVEEVQGTIHRLMEIDDRRRRGLPHV